MKNELRRPQNGRQHPKRATAALLYIMKAGARTSLNAFFPILYVVCIIGAPLFPNFVGKRGELCQYYCGLAFVRLVPNPRRKKILT